MPKRSVSVFLLVHGVIVPRNESRIVEENRIEYSIGCEPLPPNVTLYAPDILAKAYYENKVNTRHFIKRKMAEWDKMGDFSDFIAERLTKFERKEVSKMYDILTQRDKDDIAGYEKQKRMPIDVKMSRRAHMKSAILKEGITWRKHECYIPEKIYILPTNYSDPNERTILVTVEEIAENGTRQLSRMLPIQGYIRNPRMNLIELREHLKRMCRLTGPNDTITFFDFSCFTFDFPKSGIEQYQPNLLSYQMTKNPDNSARIIYGTMRKDVINEMRNAEEIGLNGVSFGDSQMSVLTLSSQEQDSGPEMMRVMSSAVRPTSELHVIVPKDATSYINFGTFQYERSRTRGRSRTRSRSRSRSSEHPMTKGGNRIKRARIQTRRIWRKMGRE
jgi:hypothetical protein